MATLPKNPLPVAPKVQFAWRERQARGITAIQKSFSHTFTQVQIASYQVCKGGK